MIVLDPFFIWLETTALSVWVREATEVYAFPSILSLHTIGMGFVAGMSAAMNLRILGVAAFVPLMEFKRFFPVLWAGFWLNAVSGVVLLIGWIVGMALSSAVRASGLAPADRALGVLFGLVRGFVVVLVIVLMAGLTPLPRTPVWRDAFLSGPFETVALALRPHLPARLGQHLKYR